MNILIFLGLYVTEKIYLVFTSFLLKLCPNVEKFISPIHITGKKSLHLLSISNGFL